MECSTRDAALQNGYNVLWKRRRESNGIAWDTIDRRRNRVKPLGGEMTWTRTTRDASKRCRKGVPEFHVHPERPYSGMKKNKVNKKKT